jgi:hypothetical protein
VPDANALPHKWQRVLRKQQLEREVCHFTDICQTSTRHRQSQNGKPFAPFDGFSDTIWQQRLIEDSIGKGKRDRLFQTVRHPDFDPSTMGITSEAKRRKVMTKLPGPVSGDF